AASPPFCRFNVPRCLFFRVFFSFLGPPPCSTLFPYTTLFRSTADRWWLVHPARRRTDLVGAGSADRLVGATGLHRSAWGRACSKIGRAHAELQSRENLVCRLLLEKKKKRDIHQTV